MDHLWGRPNLDAFGRLRVSNPAPLIESSFEYDLRPSFFDTRTSANGTVTHDSDLRSAILTVTADSDSEALLQSYAYLPYEKGKSQYIKLTFVLGAATTGVTKELGYGDDANGVFLRQAGDGTLSWVLRSSVSGSMVETVVAQSDWNVDSCDGTGPSHYDFDVTMQQILTIDAQFLGTGRVRCGFNIDGRNVICHEFLNANRNTVGPYMQTFNLPVRWQIEASGVTAGDTLQAICCEVESEGGISAPTGEFHSAANAANVATSTSRTPILAIRPATTFNSITNRILPVLDHVSAYVTGAAHLIEVAHDAGLTGGAWASNSTSSVEIGTGQSITTPGTTDGTIIHSYFVAASGSGANQVGSGNAVIGLTLPITLDIDGANPTVLVVYATAVAGTGTARVALDWQEIK